MVDPLTVHDDFDLRLQLPNHALFVGATMSGKTSLLLNILNRADQCIEPVPKTILLYYDQHQEAYEKLKRDLSHVGIDVSLRQGGENLSLEEFEKHDHQTLLVIDDAGEQTAASQSIAKIATNGRHKNLSLWLIWHSLFSKHPASRIIAQNSAYVFFLPSPRLGSQIHSLDSQLRYSGALSSAYAISIEEKDRLNRYLLLDLAASTPNIFRLRSRVTDPNAQILYLK